MSAANVCDWDTKDWVRKLKQQADENREFRHNLYQKIGLNSESKILDVGCGTGVITEDIAEFTGGDVTGLDISSENIKYARKSLCNTEISLVQADGLFIPFKDQIFDAVVFCGVLMYIKDKQRAVQEMARVLKKGGILLATLEPDYGNVVCYPEDPALSAMFEALKDAGADIETGRKLRGLFSQAGLTPEVGLFTEFFDYLNRDVEEQIDWYESQFWFMEKGLLKEGWTPQQIEEYERKQIQLVKDQVIFQFAPVFFCIGRK